MDCEIEGGGSWTTRSRGAGAVVQPRCPPRHMGRVGYGTVITLAPGKREYCSTRGLGWRPGRLLATAPGKAPARTERVTGAGALATGARIAAHATTKLRGAALAGYGCPR